MSDRVFSVGVSGLPVHDQPSADAAVLARLAVRQLVARLDLIERGAWWRVFADTPGDGAYVGYIDATQLRLLDRPNQPAMAPVAPAAPILSTRFTPEWLAPLQAAHGYRNSVTWRLASDGLRIGDAPAAGTSGKLVTVPRVWKEFGASLRRWCAEYGTPLELAIATICTETRGDPTAIRLEPGYTSDEATAHRISPGLMQTLISTARGALKGEVEKHTITREWLLIPDNSIRAGVKYIADQRSVTDFDPPRVACAYNAGDIKPNNGETNRWKMLQYPKDTGEHADRFIEWFNDCIRFFATVQGDLGAPSFQRWLREQDTERMPESAAERSTPLSPSLAETATSPPASSGAPREPVVAPASDTAPVSSSGAPRAPFRRGHIDASVTGGTLSAYRALVARLMGEERSAASTRDGFTPHVIAAQPGTLTISALQAMLQTVGLLPAARPPDGIYGYRTESAVRIFQEYLRTVEKKDVVADGVFGSETHRELSHWVQSGSKPLWKGDSTEYDNWLALIAETKQRYLAAPSRELQLVTAHPNRGATRAVADWESVGEDRVHLIGVRRLREGQTLKEVRSDDVYILLVRGLVFKFIGSMDAGNASSDGEATLHGAPHLVQGQHVYRFGWHKKLARSQLALIPAGKGVLVARRGKEGIWQAADLDRGLFGPNPTINIHWGGLGRHKLVGNWSHGCQAIAGSSYVDPDGNMRRCPNVAPNDTTRQENPALTRGAFDLIADLVTLFSPDAVYTDDKRASEVLYTVLVEEDLTINPGLQQTIARAREQMQD